MGLKKETLILNHTDVGMEIHTENVLFKFWKYLL